MIRQETIEEIKSRIDIVDVIGDFVSLKKAGSSYKAISPFTDEKTPSFFVVPSKGIYKDFSSGKAGDALSFIMEHEGLTYIEALRYLARKYGVEIIESNERAEISAEQTHHEKIYALINFAKEQYQYNLLHHEEGKGVGLSYFRERDFNDPSIRSFELGYALNSWDQLSKEALKKGYSKDLLEQAGLVVRKSQDNSYDRFRGRVIFPIHSMSGKVIAFGARIVGKDKNQPKYINSPETEIYNKSHVLYGLFQAKNAIRRSDTCYLVEGYTDVISLHQAGIENTVSSSGTALTEDQIKLIKRFSDKITILFDGDIAGIKAALRGIDLILQEGLNVRIVLFPDGDDPDSCLHKVGITEFKRILDEETKDFISFKADLYAAEAGGDPIRRVDAIKEVVGSIAQIPDPVKRSIYIQETSRLFKIGEEMLITELNKILIQLRRSKEQQQNKEVSPIDISLTDSPPFKGDINTMVDCQEREIIRLLLSYTDMRIEGGTLSDFMWHELEDVVFVNRVYSEIYEAFKVGWASGKPVDSAYFFENGSEEVKKTIANLVVFPYEVSNNWEDKYQIYFPKENEILHKMAYTTVIRLKLRIVQRMAEQNRIKIKNTPHEELDQLLVKQINLDQAKKELSELLGIVIVQ